MFQSNDPLSPKRDNDSVEEAVVLLIANTGQTIDRLAFTGGMDHLSLPWRDITSRALQSDCHAMVLMHTHPSGSCRPSDADIHVTRALSRMLRMLEIKLLDHIIVTQSDSFSFRDNGLL